MAIERYYTKDQVTQILQISQSTLWRIIKRGEIVPCKVGRAVRIAESEIIRYLEGGRQCQ